MACAAVTGAAARVLSQPKYSSILKMERGRARSLAMEQVVLESAEKLGFGDEYEGHGLIIHF